MVGFEYSDVVVRTTEGERRYFASDNVRRHGYEQAFLQVKKTLETLGLDVSRHSFDDDTALRIEEAFAIANTHGLLGLGGVPPWNFLGLWILNNLLAPTHYLESGYFRGSSILAALGNKRLQNIFGFDPNPKNLALTDFPDHVNVSLSHKDFSKIAPFNTSGTDALVYFDDHINTAQRILEAYKKGYRRLVFDDSCGLTGTSQRHWPSMPSLYFITHIEDFNLGDFIEWPSPLGRANDGSGGDSQLRVTFDAELIDLCRRARDLIHDSAKLPDLSDYVLWPSASSYPDVTQHLVLLKNSPSVPRDLDQNRQELNQTQPKTNLSQNDLSDDDRVDAENSQRPNREAVVFLAWGKKFINELSNCIEKSSAFLEGMDLVLITDEETDVELVREKFAFIVRHKFKTNGLLRKTELIDALPETSYEAYMFLDSDTVLLGDISLGFAKAKQFGIALAPAPHYSLDAFWDFGKVMEKAGVPLQGQLQYNTGVFFFVPREDVVAVFETWRELAIKFQNIHNNDQPFFTLAMEYVGFNPYTLTISYNYRGFGDAISGDVRIWHSHGELPEGINSYTRTWPPRRAFPGRVDFTDYSENQSTSVPADDPLATATAERDAAKAELERAKRYPWKYLRYAAKLRIRRG